MIGRMEVMREHQDLRLGTPRLRKLPDGDYEATFVYPAGPDVKTVQLAGSFNDWRPEAAPMQGPDREGRFTIRLKLKAGRHEYRYRIDGREWQSDPGNPVQAGFYNNSVLQAGE